MNNNNNNNNNVIIDNNDKNNDDIARRQAIRGCYVNIISCVLPILGCIGGIIGMGWLYIYHFAPMVRDYDLSEFALALLMMFVSAIVIAFLGMFIWVFIQMITEDVKKINGLKVNK